MITSARNAPPVPNPLPMAGTPRLTLSMAARREDRLQAERRDRRAEQLRDDVRDDEDRVELAGKRQPARQRRIVDAAGDVPRRRDEQANRQPMREGNRDEVPALPSR